MRPSRWTVAALGVLLAALIAASAATGSQRERLETARSGVWAAALQLTLKGSPGYERIVRARLRVEREGATVLARTLRLPDACGGRCVVVDDSARTLALRRLGGADPVVLLWLWTGGAHCCTVVQAIELPGGRTTSRNFGNGGASLDTIDGAPLFVAQDERFPYRYTSYAASSAPVALVRLGGGRFTDVTAKHPEVVAEDARAQWALYVGARTGGDEVRGLFAAWAADTCRLGRRARVEERLRDGVRAGWFSPPRAEPAGPHGARYAATLLRDLERLGYCASP